MVSPTGSHSPNHQQTDLCGLKQRLRGSVGSLGNHIINCYITVSRTNTQFGGNQTVESKVIKVAAKLYEHVNTLDRVKEFFGLAQKVVVNLKQDGVSIRKEMLVDISSLFQRLSPLKDVNIAESVQNSIQRNIQGGTLRFQPIFNQQSFESQASAQELIKLAKQFFNQLTKEEIEAIKKDFKRIINEVRKAKTNQSMTKEESQFLEEVAKKLKGLEQVSIKPDGENSITSHPRLSRQLSKLEEDALNILDQILNGNTSSSRFNERKSNESGIEMEIEKLEP